MSNDPLGAVPVEPHRPTWNELHEQQAGTVRRLEAELLTLRAERDKALGWMSIAADAEDRADALAAQLTEVRDFVVRCYHIRGGSPNAFYQHVDAFCKAFPNTRG